MSLYDSSIQQLPRPDRGLFSTGSESTRATLPDFANVAQLGQFTHRLLYWRVEHQSLFIQVKAGASFICLLILIVGLILARRLYMRSLWLIRLMKRPAGIILVPNSTLIFAFMDGIFGVIFVALLWKTCYFFETPDHTPTNYMLWLVLPWCALLFAVFWAAWGTYFATPNALQSSLDGKSISGLQKYLLRPYVVNLTGLLIPVVMSVTVMIPAILSNTHWQEALDMEQQWQVMYSTQPDFSQDMVLSSQRVWFETLRAMEKACIAYLIWTVFAIIASLAFLSASWGLMLAIRRELKSEAILHDNDTHDDANSIEEEVKPTRAGHFAMERGKHSTPPIVAADEYHQPTPSELEANEVLPSLYASIRPHHNAERQQQTSEALNSQDESHAPPLLAGITPDLPAPRPGKNQREYLRSALHHVYIQACAVFPACLAFGGVALLLCLTLYGKLEQPSMDGGNQFEHYFGIAVLIVNWNACLFGGVTLLAIAHRTYEPFLSTAISLRPSANGDVALLRRHDGQRHTCSSFFETQSQTPDMLIAVAKRAPKDLDPVNEEGYILTDHGIFISHSLSQIESKVTRREEPTIP